MGRIGYNIHAPYVKDTMRLKQHLAKVQPSAVVVMDGLGLAEDIHAMLPNAVVIHRNYGVTKGDDDIHTRVNPVQWLDLRAKEAANGIYLYTTNEPGFSQEAIDWHVWLMEEAIKRSIRLVVGNFAVGTPGAEDWKLAKPMLELLDQYRDLFILGLHEYACGIITSGLYGGYPDHAGVQPGDLGGKNLIEKWPASLYSPEYITAFHCGRFRFLTGYCASIGLKPPRIILTEHGMDDVSDIKPWAERLEKTAPYTSIRGWKSLRAQWNKWFKPNGWSAERAYFEQLAWADRVMYQGSPVEGQCIFSWGYSSNDWEQFDVAEASEFQQLMEGAAQPVSNPPPVVVQPTPAPAPKPIGLPVFPTSFALRARDGMLSSTVPTLNIRELPTVKARAIGMLTPKAVPGKYIPIDELSPAEAVIEVISDEEGIWIPIAMGELQGWVFSAFLTATPLQVKQMDKARLRFLAGEMRKLLDEMVTTIGE